MGEVARVYGAHDKGVARVMAYVLACAVKKLSHLYKDKPKKTYASVIGIREGDWAVYERYHAAVWPDVLKTIHDCNIRNYSIYRFGELLFSYFEYIGADFEADMEKMAYDPKTIEWWAVMKPLQQRVLECSATEWWHTIPEVFHVD